MALADRDEEIGVIQAKYEDKLEKKEVEKIEIQAQ
jgi:hypothetical protein